MSDNFFLIFMKDIGYLCLHIINQKGVCDEFIRKYGARL